MNTFFTFGSPRVGDVNFANWFDNTFNLTTFSARVVHYDDPVPHLPPEDFGY